MSEPQQPGEDQDVVYMLLPVPADIYEFYKGATKQEQQPGKDKETVRVSLRVPADLHKEIITQAQLAKRSVNAQVVWLLRRAVEGEGPRGGS
jgi:predicted HicB family RNase H-like nuclease